VKRCSVLANPSRFRTRYRPVHSDGMARKQLIATVAKTARKVSRPERFVLAETKLLRNSFETVLFKFCFSFISVVRTV